jgi:hypothetical protein
MRHEAAPFLHSFESGCVSCGINPNSEAPLSCRRLLPNVMRRDRQLVFVDRKSGELAKGLDLNTLIRHRADATGTVRGSRWSVGPVAQQLVATG